MTTTLAEAERIHRCGTVTELGEIHACARRRGQSLIESCIVMGIMCFVFLGVFQLSQLFAAKEFLSYAAARGVRAKAVGFNHFMVWKTMRVGVIPNAGVMTSPGFQPPVPAWGTGTPAQLWNAWHTALSQTPSSAQGAVEQSRIPLYLGAEWNGQLQPILDYEDWDTVSIPDPVEDLSGMVSVKVSQDYPLRVPMHTAFYAGDSIEMSGEAGMENHHALYLSDSEL